MGLITGLQQANYIKMRNLVVLGRNLEIIQQISENKPINQKYKDLKEKVCTLLKNFERVEYVHEKHNSKAKHLAEKGIMERVAKLGKSQMKNFWKNFSDSKYS